MLKKKETYTNVTPIPSNIPRQLAIEILQSHGEIITLNPLVTGYEPIKAPRDASAEEFYSTWYEIEERIQFVPGMGRIGSGKIKFRGCFHDMPWGLQTHIYAPAGVDLRNTWRIAGNQPGEPKEVLELGINAPSDGLYLREDVEIKCNVTMVSFVKKETKAASKALVDRLIKKAELLDSGVLLAMMENGRLKTVNPLDRTNTVSSSNYGNSPTSPTQYAPRLSSPTFPPKMTLPFQPGAKASPYSPNTYHQHQQQPTFSNAPQEIRFELPGNYHYLSPQPHQVQQKGEVSELPAASPATSTSGRWSNSQSDNQSYSNSRPTSVPTTLGSFRSTKNDYIRPSSELPTVKEKKTFYNK